MKVARTLFVSSAVFSGVLGFSYWWVAREPAGTTLLAFMTAALLVIAGYMFFAERDADLFADRPDATMQQAAGEHVGTYVTQSRAPFWIAIAVGALVLGLVVSPAAAGLGIVALFFLGLLLILQSR